MNRKSNIVKQPSIIAESGQLLIIPTFIALLTFNNLINSTGNFSHSVILFSIIAFMIHQSNINIFAINFGTRFFIIMMFAMLLFILSLPLNYFLFKLQFQTQLVNGPIQIIISSIFNCFDKYPGCRSLVESQIMFQVLLFSINCLEQIYSRKPKFDIYYYDYLNQNINTILVKLSLKIYFLSLVSSLILLLMFKYSLRQQNNWIDKLLTFIKLVFSICVISQCFIKPIFYTKDDQLTLFQTIQQYQGEKQTQNLDYNNFQKYLLFFVSFFVVKISLNHLFKFNKIKSKNIKKYKHAYTQYDRKSYHLLLYLFIYGVQGSIHIMLLVSSFGLILISFLESLRGQFQFPFQFFFDYSNKYITDKNSTVAISHFQLLISVSLFPALSLILNDRVQYFEYASLFTVITADAVASLFPAVYYIITNEKPFQWIQTLQMSFISIPIYKNWNFSNSNSELAFIHDLGMKLDTSEYKDKQRIEQFEQILISRYKYLFKGRTILGTFSYIVTSMLSMCWIKTEVTVIILFGVLNGIFESLCVEDNILLPFVQGSLIILFKGSFTD